MSPFLGYECELVWMRVTTLGHNSGGAKGIAAGYLTAPSADVAKMPVVAATQRLANGEDAEIPPRNENRPRREIPRTCCSRRSYKATSGSPLSLGARFASSIGRTIDTTCPQAARPRRRRLPHCGSRIVALYWLDSPRLADRRLDRRRNAAPGRAHPFGGRRPLATYGRRLGAGHLAAPPTGPPLRLASSGDSRHMANRALRRGTLDRNPSPVA
jgi:hypothetical protein